ncbi:protein phosphatase 2C domain-containing protein [Roseisolibacter sp. H3M3-2]|uniref:PP2C family protein-serine/threonine phosphatase n=1 Tax=Roseisolibacter sp. H3M3-2 TaxID=3031323 RepID=UPI0023DAF604|nr:protein phosphatase 2C domain-containing protein [Roseisolibacter sp. H3M3-2]MDF1504580.1 protein phosphatase 2C domain-containing protein [Roseisolibacter sp. H3M3-2]
MTTPHGPSRPPRDDEIDVHGLSHRGSVRTENQDHFLLATIHKRVHVIATNLEDAGHRLPVEEQRLAYLAMVADGVGGGVGGAEASAAALEAAMHYVNESTAVYYGARADEAEFTLLLQAAAMRAHEAVRARRAALGAQGTVATTLTLYIGVWPTYYLLQVGDSRYYVWNGGRLRQVTRDQTMAQDLVDTGVLSSDAASRTPLAHVLSSALGSDTTAPVVTRLDADWGNVHLLCSDGLTKHVSDARIAEVLGAMTSARQACEQLLQDALAGGGTDNVTIIVGRALAPATGG